MSQFPASRIRLWAALAALLLLQAACGGGGGGDGIGSGGTGITGLSGAVTKGPVSNATVVAYAVTGGQRGTQIGSASTDANGNFSMSIGSYQGPVLLQASAGTYRDEATGIPMTLSTADVLSAVVVASPATLGPGSNPIQVTPVTSMAQARAKQLPGGMTEANIATANAAIGSYFGISDIVHVQPINPLLPGSAAGASTDARNYGMILAGISELALTVGATNSAAVVTALISDAADGVLNGRNGDEPIHITAGGVVGSVTLPANAGNAALAVAMLRFAASTSNVSGLTGNDIAALAQRISGSGGKF